MMINSKHRKATRITVGLVGLIVIVCWTLVAVSGCATIKDKWHDWHGDKAVDAVISNAVAHVVEKIPYSPKAIETPATQPSTTPVEPASASQDEVDHGFAHPATIVYAIALKSVNGSLITFSGDDRPESNWPPDKGPGTCNSDCHLYILVGNEWQGGKFDHAASGTTVRDWKNVLGGYGIWSELQPVTGQQCAFVIIKDDGKERTNAIFFQWP